MKEAFFWFEMIMQADDAHIFSRKYRQKYTKGRSQKSDHQIQSPVVFSRDFCTLTWSVASLFSNCSPIFSRQPHPHGDKEARRKWLERHCTQHANRRIAFARSDVRDLPSRSWRVLKWRRWRGCHTRIWFGMNRRRRLCSSAQTTIRAGRICTKEERNGTRRRQRSAGEAAWRADAAHL